jgi:predicted ribosome quality control (RQC) complex YloA/Tae2 family protein
MIDNYYAYYQEKEKFISLKNHFLTLTNQKLKRTNNSINKMKNQIEREENCDRYRLYGDLIIANLYLNKDYSSVISVYDYENNKNINIELDSTKTLKDNAAKFYKLYNKGKTSKQKLTELSEELLQTKQYLEQLEYSINSAQTYEDLIEINPEFEEKAQTKEIRKAINPEKLVIGNYTVYIGKNNRQNDYIVSKISKDDDLWFHTKDCAGSHVLLRGLNPTEEIILECAKLAKQYSSASQSSKIGVIYTKRKYLKKPPKANLGYVIYKNEKEIIV